MKKANRHLPALAAALISLLMLVHGPIPQPPDYHHFADARSAFTIPNAADVLSNIGFAVAGIWGWLCIRRSPGMTCRPGYLLFLAALVMTAAGSFFYHLAPDDARLVWDRIPIALACAGLLAAIHAESTRNVNEARNTGILALAAIASVMWWVHSGDLGPYLLLQALPLALIPLWQWTGNAPHQERIAFAIAILLYLLAKAAELHDHAVMAMSGIISGHTLKHLLATMAAGMIVSVLARRTRRK